MALSHNLGFPRIGAKRELKQALEAYWRGEIDAEQLESVGTMLRRRHWILQKEAGIHFIPVGDFSFYDQVLDMSVLLGAVPARFELPAGAPDLTAYFAMARGTATQAALEMTKWFDTNYHYLVPELQREMHFRIGSERLFRYVGDAQRLGVRAKPVLLGPLSFLYLAKIKGEEFDRLDLLDGLVAVYAEILERLRKQGVEWVQIDEPVLTLDLPQRWIEALDSTYARLHSSRIPKLLLCTYFESVAEHSERLKRLPVAGLHLDLIRSPQQLDAFLDRYPEDKVLSLGVVDGRNIWRCNLAETLQLLESVQQGLGKRLWVAPSCSLLHSPINVDAETKLAPDLRSWLAFGTQKLGEVATLVRGLNEGSPAIQAALDLSNASHTQRQRSPRIHDPAVAQRLAASTTADATRQSPYAARQEKQRLRFDLPAFPTTTIGSFPQTSSIRSARAAHKRGAIGEEAYATAMKEEIALVVRQQETIGLDVLVHGEAERNDMVEYFGEQLRGFAFSEHGWVQSYGSRCVKPPIIYGDVSRPRAMTVEWFRYAQSLTTKPMKGMLTGPVTMLQWSFERDDQPRAQTARQIALAIRDEVLDLEAAGAGMIQIDEPAFREGLPLKASARAEYLDWAVEAFRLAGAGVRDDTQIHTHMCYAEFNDILSAIAALDADVITIETSRSDMELLKGFGSFRYPNEMGPGVYDIHSPRVPDTEDMLTLLRKACAVIDPRRLWVNPDCGLKTRGWPEVELALNRMVAAAQLLRTQY